MERAASCNPWDYSGPSLIASENANEFYAQGHRKVVRGASLNLAPRAAKPAKKKEPKPRPPVAAMREYLLQGHTIRQTAEKFRYSYKAVQYHVGPIKPLKTAVDVDAIRAYIAAGHTYEQAAKEFRHSEKTIRRHVGKLATIRSRIPWRRLSSKAQKFSIYLTAEMKAWVKANGGQIMVRGLIAKAMSMADWSTSSCATS